MNKSDREMMLEIKDEIAELTKLVKELSLLLGYNKYPKMDEPEPYNPPRKKRSPFEPIFYKEREYFNP